MFESEFELMREFEMDEVVRLRLLLEERLGELVEKELDAIRGDREK